MAEHSTIEWTDATWNPITGCTLVSEGCRHCYAAGLAATRLKHHPSRAGLARINAAGEAKFTGEVRFNEEWIDQPLRWKRPRRIFVCAHGDLFHEQVPDEWINRVFRVMAMAKHHTFQVLTKRPERAMFYLAAEGRELEIRSHEIAWPLPNVWLGTSVEDQATADERIPHLLATPAAVRFLSAEPLLGLVDLTRIRNEGDALRPDALRGRCVTWVIVGGESGRHARPMHPDWARSLRDQCAAAGVPYFFKQWGEWSPVTIAEDEDGALGPAYPMRGCSDPFTHGNDQPCTFWHRVDSRWVEWPHLAGSSAIGARRVGKKAAGRMLDGREWSQMPPKNTPRTKRDF